MVDRPAVTAPLTDSFWFWLLLFSAMGLVALAVIGPKYSRRQARIELQYQAHQEIERRQFEGEPAARPVGAEGSAEPPAPGDLIIPLWPLFGVISAMCLISAAGLWRARRASAATALANAGHGGPGAES